MHTTPLLVLPGWSVCIIEYPSMDNALSSFETKESIREYQICELN